MKRLLIMSLMTFFSLAVHAQATFDLSFEKKIDSVKRSVSTKQVFQLKLKLGTKEADKIKDYKVDVTADLRKSTLPANDYEIDFKPVLLTDMGGEYTFYLVLNSDKEADRTRSIYLNLIVKDKDGKAVTVGSNSGKEQQMEIVVKPSDIALKDYSYLGYVGTNFDLVDGVKPKNLFFAASIFLPPTEGKRWGFNVLFYGNRAFTNTISNGMVRYASKIVGKENSTAMTYYNEGLETIDRKTDNLGAMFAPLIYIGNKDHQSQRTFQIYYSPQIEFIWRRTAVTTSYSDAVLVDSTLMQNRPITGTVTLTPQSQTIPFNVYDVNVGFLAFTLKHETPGISLRVGMTFGKNFSYLGNASRGNARTTIAEEFERLDKWYVSSRLWITEPGSGITFGAEIYNNVFGDYQPYYIVTLSKAINFANLGKIFSPITTR